MFCFDQVGLKSAEDVGNVISFAVFNIDMNMWTFDFEKVKYAYLKAYSCLSILEYGKRVKWQNKKNLTI